MAVTLSITRLSPEPGDSARPHSRAPPAPAFSAPGSLVEVSRQASGWLFVEAWLVLEAGQVFACFSEWPVQSLVIAEAVRPVSTL